MKKFFTFVLLLTATTLLQVNAREISQNEALDLANNFLLSQPTSMKRLPGNALTIAYTANDNEIYVFNRGENNGFVIVAGDDMADNTILGYSDEGNFDYNNMPDNMRYWIDQYQQEIALARTSQKRAAQDVRQSLFDKDVAPLVEARWGQDAPFNNLCPMYGGSTRCATGCVATAMAQIMYHHKWPEHGVGEKLIMNGSQDETIDFANTTYQWDVMTPVYSSLSTEEECNAVATLMYHVGRSVDMIYSNASGAVSADAAYAWATYWNYDKSVVHRDRKYYTIDEWESMIKEEIDNNRPILYHGQSEEGGHAFVLDGYNSNGYVHINWGWYGMSNGYFMLHALTPEHQGTGGFKGGYNNGQGAIFGIQPNKGGNAAIEITAESLYIAPGTYTLGEELEALASSLTNGGWHSASFSIGFMLHDTNNQLIETIACGDLTIPGSNNKGKVTLKFNLPTTLADGTYRMYLAHSTGQDTWKHVGINPAAAPFYNVIVENGQATINSDTEGEIWATSVVCNNDKIYSNRFTTFTITMSNTRIYEYFGSIHVSIYESKGKFEQRKSDAIALAIPAGSEIVLEIPIKIGVAKGDYCIFITDSKKKKLSEALPITVLAEPASIDLQVSNMQLTNTAKDQLEVQYSITNNGEDYSGQIRAWVLFNNGTPTSSFDNSEFMTIKQGETIDFTHRWSFDDGIEGETYMCSLWYSDNRNGAMTQLRDIINFTLTKETGLDKVAATQCTLYPNPATQHIIVSAQEEILSINIYNLQGALVRSITNIANTSTTIAVEDMPRGTYLVETITSRDNTMNKVIIL